MKNKYTDDRSEDDDFKYFEEYKKSRVQSMSEEDEAEEQRRLDNLRKEMDVMNGEEEEPVDDEEDEAKRSMKIMLKSGIIPDATMIHQARKKREMARQGDYIPIANSGQSKNKSRVIRYIICNT